MSNLKLRDVLLMLLAYCAGTLVESVFGDGGVITTAVTGVVMGRLLR